MPVVVPTASTVNFPYSDPLPPLVTHPTPQARPPHLPFRRISLPTPPTAKHRESVTSVASYDSLPGENPGAPPTPGSSNLRVPVVMRNANAALKPNKYPPGYGEGARRGKKREPARPVDEARESRRHKVIQEFYETEKAYVGGLDLVYSLFLTPIITSLDTPQPLLDRASLTSVFSNFVDIWNLHRSFLSSLSTLLSSTPPNAKASPLSPVLLSHFPYLSLYTPFITSFNTTITSLTNVLSPSHPSYNPTFAQFLAKQESDPRCGKLKLRDWMLSIVQRCPRYLLLLKDLIICTDPEDPEHQQLTSVHSLVSKITLSLNTSLHTHAQTLALLALQRNTTGLPPNLHFISPGRALLHRGPLIMIDPRGEGRIREFLLFSDCLVWLENESAPTTNMIVGVQSGLGRPIMSRSRSKSEAELSDLKAQSATSSSSPPSSYFNSSDPTDHQPPKSAPPTRAPRMLPQHFQRPTANNVKRHASSISQSNSNSEEKWAFKGKAQLVDLEVVIVGGLSDDQERCFEVLSPEGSFAVYAATEIERDEWSGAIRNAKAALLMTLNVTHPNSTLTSSASTNHLRRSLQALPFHPGDHRLDGGEDESLKRKKKKGKVKERRGRVEHWVPPIWIPDSKTEGCMRCGRGFSWRRRRHHCRLCGRCVCSSCSERTFYISDSNTKGSTKAARACNACYETVFPILDHASDSDSEQPNTSSKPLPTSSSSPYMNTGNTLTGFPSWMSMPSLPLPASQTPDALMALLDREPARRKSSVLPRIEDDEGDKDLSDEGGGRAGSAAGGSGGGGAEVGPNGRVRVRAVPPRPRSSYEIFEDGEEGHRPEGVVEEGEGECEGDGSETSPAAAAARRREDTARRNKRFSVPAVALQRTSVFARTAVVESEREGVGGKMKRFSLVLGGRVHGRGGSGDGGRGAHELSKGIAVVKLSELLGRRKV